MNLLVLHLDGSNTAPNAAFFVTRYSLFLVSENFAFFSLKIGCPEALGKYTTTVEQVRAVLTDVRK